MPIYKTFLPFAPAVPRMSKKGLAWSSTHCGDQVALGIYEQGGWYHRWSSRPNGCKPEPKFIPLWRPSNAHEWDLPLNYQGYVLFLNEPDRPDQDNLTVEEAIVAYSQFRAICPQGQALVLGLARGDNTTFAAAWWQVVSHDNIAGFQIHAYGNRAEIESQVIAFRAWMEAAGLGGLELWLSEFGGAFASQRPQLSPVDLQLLLDKFESWEFLNRYAFFPVRWGKPGDTTGLPDALFVGDSQELTALGEVYRGNT